MRASFSSLRLLVRVLLTQDFLRLPCVEGWQRKLPPLDLTLFLPAEQGFDVRFGKPGCQDVVPQPFQVLHSRFSLVPVVGI
jgi:hypothetical protein